MQRSARRASGVAASRRSRAKQKTAAIHASLHNLALPRTHPPPQSIVHGPAEQGHDGVADVSMNGKRAARVLSARPLHEATCSPPQGHRAFRSHTLLGPSDRQSLRQ